MRISSNGAVCIGTLPDSTFGDLVVANNTLKISFYTYGTNNIFTKVITLPPYSTTGGPYSNGYWLIDISPKITIRIYMAASAIYWFERIVIASSGSASYYSDNQIISNYVILLVVAILYKYQAHLARHLLYIIILELVKTYRQELRD